jgi:serine/threonine-protein kinase/endoribonuclease IRE1
MRRFPGASSYARSASLRTVFALLFALPLALAIGGQAQHEQWDIHERSIDGLLSSLNVQSPTSSATSPSLAPGMLKDIDELGTYNGRRNNKGLKTDDGAVSASAPAIYKEKAVAAPPARSSRAISNFGGTPPANVRSLQDWEVEDFVLLATVDGTIHARDRNTGMPRWALQAEKPMVETTYHRLNKGYKGEKRPQEDLMWIIEPSRDGKVFIYKSDPPEVQSLDLTVKQLGELTPYESSEPSVVYTAQKKSTLYTIDARTGNVVTVYGPGTSHVSDGSKCRSVSGLGSLDVEACGSNRTLALGRTEYEIAIHDSDGEPICTIKYWEWVINGKDSSLQSQYKRTMDNKYIFSRFDGSILGFEHSQNERGRRKLYTQKLSSPVVRVFDVARPTENTSKESPLIILPQPSIRNVDQLLFEDASEFDNLVFINHTETGGWYAMSERSYPLVTDGASEALCYTQHRYAELTSLDVIDTIQKQKSIVGRHSLAHQYDHIIPNDFINPKFPAIGGPPESNLLDPEPNHTDSEEPPMLNLLPPSTPLSNSKLLGFASANFVDMVLLVPLLTLLFFFYVNKQKFGRILFKTLDVEKMPVLKDMMASPPASPLPPELLGQELVIPYSSREDPSLDPNTAPETKSQAVRDKPRGAVKFADIENESDEDAQTQGEDGATKKKGRARGSRGGRRKGKRGKTPEPGEKLPETASSQMDEINERLPIVESSPLGVAASTRLSGEVALAPGYIQINSLIVSKDDVIGQGSSGTVVFKGQFEGRAVAVKRMQQVHYDVASHEVKLLQESDDHPNVIRYYCKQQDTEFLYIALELCPASLQDVIEKPQDHAELTRYIDKANMLYQITNGLRHLHSLKIVHRDLKPQNILVAAPKIPRGNANMILPPRLLISDFGLCKKLDTDQSSFRATTAHAAGTSGWRAPELLVDEDSVTSKHSMTSDTVTSGSISDAVIDPTSNRRATKAIDIFSLGCVFFYVLSQGGHPFGDRYEREINIIHSKHNLDALLSLGDYGPEAIDLVSSMITKDPKRRPDATSVMTHPFFWSAEKRLNFLVDLSDHFEWEIRDPPSPDLCVLESNNPAVIGVDFLKKLDKSFVETLGKQRKYTGSRMLDLLRALRNKKNHYQDMPQNVKDRVGELPTGYLSYWTTRFPKLLLHGRETVLKCNLQDEPRFKPYFLAPGRDG